jgi:hypothetical protein
MAGTTSRSGTEKETRRGRFEMEPADAIARRFGDGDPHQEAIRYFRDNFPILLDGALFFRPDPARFVRQARESLMRGAAGRTAASPPFLRDTLASIRAEPRPSTKIGAVAIAPRSARVWWDVEILRLSPVSGEDILAGLATSRPILRFYDFTGLDPAFRRWNSFFDIDIDPTQNGKTIEFWAADRSYQVELGLLRTDGGFERLARSTHFTLPREGRGAEEFPITVTASLPRMQAKGRVSCPSPDAEALHWLDSRPDFLGRDFQAELIIHLLYRDYLREGQKILRAAPALSRRDPGILANEYRRRTGFRTRRLNRRPTETGLIAPPLLILQLDSTPSPLRSGLAFPPASLSVPGPASVWLKRNYSPICLAAVGEILHYAAMGIPYPIPVLNASLPPSRSTTTRYVEPTITGGNAAGLVSFLKEADDDRDPAIVAAEPVFAAAASLRRNLAALAPVLQEESGPAARCGGRMGERFAKSGVHFTGLSLVLEGRTRPGARLKIGGKRIAVGADGRFRIECVLSGRKNGVPIDVDAPSGGGIRGRIVLEWQKRPAGGIKALAR